jgi:hypothetical protein
MLLKLPKCSEESKPTDKATHEKTNQRERLLFPKSICFGEVSDQLSDYVSVASAAEILILSRTLPGETLTKVASSSVDLLWANYALMYY